jgi:hypothetical protein
VVRLREVRDARLQTAQAPRRIGVGRAAIFPVPSRILRGYTLAEFEGTELVQEELGLSETTFPNPWTACLSATVSTAVGGLTYGLGLLFAIH